MILDGTCIMSPPEGIQVCLLIVVYNNLFMELNVNMVYSCVCMHVGRIFCCG